MFSRFDKIIGVIIRIIEQGDDWPMNDKRCTALLPAAMIE
jgi:hypothetical protein